MPAYTEPTIFDTWHFRTRSGVRSTPNAKGRYTENTSYGFNEGFTTLSTQGVSVGNRIPPNYGLGVSGASQNLKNRAYGEFVEQLGTKSEQLTAAVEWRTSLEMIAVRADQLRKAYLAVRRGQIEKARRILRMSPGGKGNSKARPTEIWLELWMGWLPAIGDMRNAAKVLSESPPFCHIVGKAFETASVFDESTFKEFPLDPNLPWFRFRADFQRNFSYYADVKVDNYNLFLANRMGLLNIPLTAFQVLPFSFIANWFVNFEQFLGSLTDFAGVSLSNSGTAYLTRVRSSKVGAESKHVGSGRYERFAYTSAQHGVTKYRGPSTIPRPPLTITFNRLSLTRAATSVSLLVEIFKPGFNPKSLKGN